MIQSEALVPRPAFSAAVEIRTEGIESVFQVCKPYRSNTTQQQGLRFYSILVAITGGSMLRVFVMTRSSLAAGRSPFHSSLPSPSLDSSGTPSC
jgi:hypothetical protein